MVSAPATLDQHIVQCRSFFTRTGTAMLCTSLWRIVARIEKQAGVRAYPHRLRHTFALQYLKRGGDPFSLQYILGHEDVTTVPQYVKVAAWDMKDLYRSLLDALETWTSGHHERLHSAWVSVWSLSLPFNHGIIPRTLERKKPRGSCPARGMTGAAMAPTTQPFYRDNPPAVKFRRGGFVLR